MHPALVAAIIVGGAVIMWGGYEAINTLYEWHHDRKEQREYEEYVRMNSGKKGQPVPVTVFENEDEDSEDDEPLSVLNEKRPSLNSQSELRRRRMYTEEEKEHELNEKEKEMPHSAMRYDIKAFEPNPFADGNIMQEETELKRQQLLLSLKGNSITGIAHDDTDSVEGNPFADNFLAREDDSPKEIQTSDIKDYVSSYIKRPSTPEASGPVPSTESIQSARDHDQTTDNAEPSHSENLYQPSTDNNFTSDEDEVPHRSADISENDSWSDLDDGRLSDRSTGSSTESFESIQHPHL